ncbi:hypothetical protein ACPOL_2716 [Acidisarcina polymorpha]|uniref:DUF2382 domain-containing protein n=1 Tax=Acidisarcina polymorpha TaxID=2211140 RepID=A0A2Z5FYS7_9BACT|nr:YsnF/AvaK domain-containing protein [Acidisarcina polymorpha]AXC12029.1 hypothetical protein ACPOL_2716 [Acidisarcina polymorpha]
MPDTSSPNIVAAFFDTESVAESAVGALLNAGFTSNQIGVASRASSAADSSAPADQKLDPVGSSDNTAHTTGHAVGAAAGSAWDKVKNFFSSDAVEPCADEKSKGDFASHEITSDYGDYSSEDIHSSLSGMSVPEERSRYFGSRFGRGNQGAIVTVSAAGREAEAEQILEASGGDLGNNSSSYDYAEADSAPISGQQRIQLLGEVLRVHKDRISRGEVRIRKEVITETQTIEVPVTRDELVIERFSPTSSTTAQGQVGECSEIRIPLTEEVASADKHTIVREEVAVGKRTVEGVRSVGDSVSHEELVVEDETKRST